MLTLWRPQSDVLELLREGKHFKMYNVMTGMIKHTFYTVTHNFLFKGTVDPSSYINA